MNRPKFDDGSGFGARAVKHHAASFIFGWPVILIGVFFLFDIHEPDDLLKALMCFVVGGIWLLCTTGNGKHISNMGNTAIKPRDKDRVVKTNHDATDTDGRGQDYYANLKDWEIQQCEDTRVEMYEAEMREYEGR